MKLKKLAFIFTASVFASSAAHAGGHTAGDLTIVSWGGAYTESQVNAYQKPYNAKHPGINFINDDSSGEAVAKLRAMSEAGNVTWDVVNVVAADAIRLCDEGLAMEIDHDAVLPAAPDGTPASKDFGKMIVADCLIPSDVYSTAFGYRTDKVGAKPPTSVCDVFDTKTYPGKRALEKSPVNNLQWALMCDGVPQAEVYDLLETDAGMQRALAKLDTIKDEVIWWSAGADTPQLLADGEVVMGSAYNGRLFPLIEEQKQPVAMLWDGQAPDPEGWIIPKGLPEDRLQRALAFLKFATDTQRLADQASYISYGPARASSAPLVSTHAKLGIDMKPHMPTDPANTGNVLEANYEWWADNRDDMNAKFQAWLAR